ncbi:MAG: recombinase [Microgenomates group bacterium Gr01-1014_16]|nr:MAG: recombinase [Microgenomates group bacterium Gr01-1014_16]
MKYIAYCRKSTDENSRQVLSIESQIAELTEFAQRESLEVVEFVTEAKTAKEPGREKFKAMLATIASGKANAILAWHPDRLARNSIDGGNIVYLLDIGKLLDLKFPSFWFDNTSQGKFILAIAFGQSKYYVDNLSENVKRGLRQKLRLGIWPSHAPLGYKNDLVTHEILVDDQKSKLVNKVFTLFLNEKSFVKISKFLLEHGVTGKNGKPLHLTRIRRMLTNPFYIGKFFYKCEWHQASHKLFLSKQLFDQVQEGVKAISRQTYHSHRFAFLGLAKCRECGATITAERHIKHYKHGGSQKFVYYRCTKKSGPCTQPYLPELEFEHQVRRIISDVALPENWGQQWLNWLDQDEQLEKLKSADQINKLTLQINDIDAKLESLLDGFLDQVVDSPSYKTKKNQLFEQKGKLEREIGQLQRDGSSWLEPMREIIKTAVDGDKSARVKNNSDELLSIGKNIGSNYFLHQRQISLDYKKGFDAVFSYARQSGGLNPAAAYLEMRARPDSNRRSLP